jgi:hypothetical protein
MKLQKGFEIVFETFNEPLSNLGFKLSTELTFVREVPTCDQSVSFGGRIDKQKRFCFNFGVGVRFEDVERILRPERHEPCSTFGCAIHLLRPSHDYLEWHLTDTVDLTVMQAEVFNDVTQYGLPFFAQYSDLNEVRRALESDDPRKWLTLTPEQRIQTLAAIEYVQGRKSNAQAMIDTALLAHEKSLPKYRLPLQRLRQRLT